MKFLGILALALLAPQPRHVYQETNGAPLSVTVTTEGGAQWCSVRASNVTLARVLEHVARKTGRLIEGLDARHAGALVTVDLARRPVEHVLEYVLGSVGLRSQLRRDTLTILPEISDDIDSNDLLVLATAAWLRALTRYPGHASAPFARLALGEIAELRSMLGAAHEHYQTLIETYPDSTSVAEAHMRSGRILKHVPLHRQIDYCTDVSARHGKLPNTNHADYLLRLR